MGWSVVPMLRLSSSDKAKEPEVQGKAQGAHKEADRHKSNICSHKVKDFQMSNLTGDAESRSISSDSGRNFLLETLFYNNGCFISISENDRKLGAISVSIGSANMANVARVIPSKTDQIFLNTVAEKISLLINGICIVSLHSKNQMNLQDMKAIMGEIMNIVESRKNKNDKGN